MFLSGLVIYFITHVKGEETEQEAILVIYRILVRPNALDPGK